MKKIINCLLIGAALVGFSSCDKFLDVNTNPNSATSSTANLILPQAIVGFASVTNTFSQNFGVVGGFYANVGGVGGYGSTLTQAYTTSNFTGLWTSSYDNIEDFQSVISANAGDGTKVFTTSMARILRAYAFARLVDQYNDVPYSDALKGLGSLSPKYDKGPDIYKDLIKELTEAMAAITTAQAAPASASIVAVDKTIDPLFGGSDTFANGFIGMDKWKRLANTIRLRLLVKMAGVTAYNAYATPLFATTAAVGYLQDDALVNPGYLKEAGRQSPNFASLASNATNVRSANGANYTTTKWALSFYNGNKINDAVRGNVIFRLFPGTPSNQLGDESAAAPTPTPTVTAWFTANQKSSPDFNTPSLGVAKYSTQGQPIFLKAESDFLQAEAQARGYIASADNGKAAFENGIKASINYLYKNSSDVATKTANPVAGQTITDLSTDLANYKTNNPGNALVDYDLATTLALRIEAISTQKYIALANIMDDEAFNEYRRTGFPRVVVGGTATQTFASKTSVLTSPDKILTRVLYPQEEYNLNSANVPTGISTSTSKIFWDVN